MKMSIEHRAIEIARKYFERDHKVDDVTRRKRGMKNRGGYDLQVLRKTSKAGFWKVEVKGSAHPWGIPDLYGTEVEDKKGNRKLVADFLFVVYFVHGRRPICCKIPRRAIKSSLLIPKLGYRIRSTFKKEKILRKFLV